MTFEKTDESVLFIEVSSFQRYPDRERGILIERERYPDRERGILIEREVS